MRSSLIVAAALAACPASAQTLVSANDGKQVMVDGVQSVPAHPVADSVSILRLDRGGLHLVKTLPAATSVIGPPRSVAITPDGRLAIVTAARRVTASDPTKIEPDDQVTLIDLRKGRILSVVHAGAGASGVAIDPSGTRALVANRAAGTLSLFAIRAETLQLLATVTLGPPESSPAQPIYFAHGKRALVTRDGDNRISVLAIDGDTITILPRAIATSLRPYAIDTTGPQRFAVTGNMGGGGTDMDTISLIDLAPESPRVVDTVAVGLTPEGVKMSPDGRYVALNIHNGTGNAHLSPTYSPHGVLQVWRIDAGRLHLVTSTPIGGWGQGLAWSRDGGTIVVQSMLDDRITTYRFNGKTLRKMGGLTMPTGPAAIAAGD